MRRFLSLCDGDITGIWLAGVGFVPLSRQAVLKLSPPCSFCGKDPFHAFGLVGIAERDAAVCDSCLGLCLDIVADEDQVRPASTWTDPDDFDALVRAPVLDQGLRDEIEQQLESARALPRQPMTRQSQCSFCDRSQPKLVAGPGLFICEACVQDAAAILVERSLRA
jgi:hypothetical protein